MPEPSLFDPPAVAASRAAGMAAAEANADTDWKTWALDGIELLARRMPVLTADDVIVWLDQCEVDTHNLAALGPIMKKAAHAGLIRSTGRYRRTKLPQRHRDVLIWESLIWGQS